MVGLTTKVISIFEPFADIGALAIKDAERCLSHSSEHARYLTAVDGL